MGDGKIMVLPVGETHTFANVFSESPSENSDRTLGEA